MLRLSDFLCGAHIANKGTPFLVACFLILTWFIWLIRKQNRNDNKIRCRKDSICTLFSEIPHLKICTEEFFFMVLYLDLYTSLWIYGSSWLAVLTTVSWATCSVCLLCALYGTMQGCTDAVPCFSVSCAVLSFSWWWQMIRARRRGGVSSCLPSGGQWNPWQMPLQGCGMYG